MEARVAKLEATIEHMHSDLSQVKSDLRDVRDRVPVVEVKIDHLPSKGFIVGCVLTALALGTAIIGYADQIKAFLN